MESDLECDPSSPADADDDLAESDENGGEPTSDVLFDCESSDIVRVQNKYYTAQERRLFFTARICYQSPENDEKNSNCQNPPQNHSQCLQ